MSTPNAQRECKSLLPGYKSLLSKISGITCFSVDHKQEKALRNEDLFLAIANLLTSAARFQPSFLLSLFSAKEHIPEASSSQRMIFHLGQRLENQA